MSKLANTTAAKIRLLNAICIPPESTCPLVQPPAIRAPKISIKPPANAQIARLAFEVPLYFFQFSWISLNLNDFVRTDPMRPAKKAPAKKINSQFPGF